MCGVRQRGQGVCYFYFKREKLADENRAVPYAVPTMPIFERRSHQRHPELYRVLALLSGYGSLAS
jgi:hypothetical protein